jgi:perosamine synthetase
MVGALGDVTAFSFYGNKIITTGEGGMVTTNNDSVNASIRQLRNQGMDPARQYWFPIIGYAYRMTNIQAAIGLAQLENIDSYLKRRRLVGSWYKKHLSGLEDVLDFPAEMPWTTKAFWMCNVFLKDTVQVERDELMRSLADAGIETRPIFYPVHLMPPYREPEGSYPVAERMSARGISLPTHCDLEEDDVAYVVSEVGKLVKQGSVLRNASGWR